jgi:chloramphenicol O-acetyltransferase type A
MPAYLDIESWPRKAAFEYFRDFDNPFFDVTGPVDVTDLRARAKAAGVPFSRAVLFKTIGVVNACESFRYRLEKGRVVVHEIIHGSTTTLLEDDRFAFQYFEYSDDLGRFLASMDAGRKALDNPPEEMDPRWDRTDLIHVSWMPWVSFTSVSHPRKWGREDSVPKLVFGRFEEREGRLLMPVSVTVHHALMDGLHVGRFFERLAAAFAEPL